jgi:hypothetical protein
MLSAGCRDDVFAKGAYVPFPGPSRPSASFFPTGGLGAGFFPTGDFAFSRVDTSV